MLLLGCKPSKPNLLRLSPHVRSISGTMAVTNVSVKILRGICSINSTAVWRSSSRGWRMMSSGAAETNAAEKSETSAGDDQTTAADVGKEEVAKLEAQLKEEKEALNKKIEDLNDKYKRSLAETENVRNRMQKQIDDAKLFGIQGFCKDLLEVADILHTATDSVTQEQLTSNTELKNMFDGLSMTGSQLQKVFTKNGLVQINPSEGEKFDPNMHEALFQQSVEGKTSDTIAVVTKVGYQLHHRTLRPALVGVFK